jgi:alpha-galactosidase
MHGRWWANDPDCLIVRDEPGSLTEAETRFLATAIAISGGMVVLSEDLAALPEARVAMARTLLPSTGITARPLDFEDGPIASTWRAEIGDGRALLAVLNWSDEPRWLTQGDILGPGETAFDFWRGKLAGMGDILLAPHDAVLLQVTAPSRHARVAGDSGHVYYEGLFQREVSARVQVRNDSAAPRTVAIRTRRGAFEVVLAPGEAGWFD